MTKHRRSATPEVTSKPETIPEPAVPGNLADRRWKVVQQELRYHWSFLSDEDVLEVAGERDELLRLLHEKYGYTRSKASSELDAALAAKRRNR